MSDSPVHDVQTAVADDAEVLSGRHGEALALERTELHLVDRKQRDRMVRERTMEELIHSRERIPSQRNDVCAVKKQINTL